MYANVGIFKIIPGNHEAMVKISEQAPERLGGHKGFKCAVFFSDKEKYEYGVITVWEGEEDYDNYLKSYSPEEMEKMMSLFSETIVRNKYYVNEIYTSD